MAAVSLGRSVFLVRHTGVSSSSWTMIGNRKIHTASVMLQPGNKERRKKAYTLGVTHSWPSRGSIQKDQTPLLQDLFIRKLIQGTFPGVDEVIIQKKANNINVTFWINLVAYQSQAPSLYFLSAYTETILSHWLACNVSVIVRGYFKKATFI